MIITNEEEQRRHEKYLQECFANKTSHRKNIRTKPFFLCNDSEKVWLQFKVRGDEGERALFLSFLSEGNFVLITNQRLVWQDEHSAECTIPLEAIKSIELGTVEQRILLNSLDPSEKSKQKQKWINVEVSTKAGHSKLLTFEPGIAEQIYEALWRLVATYRTQQKSKEDREAYIAHKFSARHRQQIEQSENCGCFCCLHIFPPKEIIEWTDHETTAMCPKCGIDSVIGDKSGYPIQKDFLLRMEKFWFNMLQQN